jgi:hypothetical protein
VALKISEILCQSKLAWTGRKFKKFLQCESIQISDRARYEEDLLRKSHVQKIGRKILEKKIFFAIFLDLINLFWTEETTMKEGSKDARFICLAASVRELGLFEFFSKGKVVKEVFAYGRNFDKHQKEGF